jgi:CRISPR system Cascade subunit CasD
MDMTHVLLFRLQAPMQAWGVQSYFSVRDTTRFPTRSGMIGLICGALGLPRESDLSEFDEFRFGVRVDRPGVMMRDFQAAQEIYLGDGKVSENPTIGNRYYLADAVFLAGIEGENLDQLVRFEAALKSPKWLLYLGRRGFPLSKPVWLFEGLQRDVSLEQALRSFPFLLPEQYQSADDQLQLVLETPTGPIVQRDCPKSFQERTFVQRRLQVFLIPVPDLCLTEVANVPE